MHLFRIIITYTIPTKVLPGLHVTQNCTVMCFNVCLVLEQIPKKIVNLFCCVCIFVVWEVNGKEIICIVDVGGKWEGNIVFSCSGREMGRN